MAESLKSLLLGFLPPASVEKHNPPPKQKVRKAALIQEVLVEQVEVTKPAREIAKLYVKREWQIAKTPLAS